VEGIAMRGRWYDPIQRALGLTLMVAAVLKGYQLATEPTPEVGVLTSRWFLIAVVEFEWAFGLWMISGLSPTVTRYGAIVCFATFACIALFKGLSGEQSCGCFGQVTVSPWSALVFDVLAVAGLLLSRPEVGSSRIGLIRARIAGVGFGSLLVGIPGVLAMANYSPTIVAADGSIVGPGGVVVLEPQTWVGSPMPLLRHVDIGKQLSKGEWAVVLYRQDCARCIEAIPEYIQMAHDLKERRDGCRLAFVELPPYGRGANPFHEIAACVTGRLSEEKTWFVETPVEIKLIDGSVASVSLSPHPKGES
jgi:hypothetical protein